MSSMFNKIFYRQPVQILLFIRKSPKPVLQTELSRRLRTHPGNISKVMKKLYGANLVRSLSIGKRKACRAYMLTAKGASIADELHRIQVLIGNA